MICKNRKCKAELPEGARFCPACGKEQEPKKTRSKRPNKAGTIQYRSDRKSKPYIVYAPHNRNNWGKRQLIGTFASKELAEQALRDFNSAPAESFNITLEQLYNEWILTKQYTTLSKSMKDGYRSAWYKLRTIKDYKVREIRTAHMQTVIDYYEGEHHQEGTGGNLLYLTKDNKRTVKKTNAPLMSPGLSFSSLSKIKCLLTSMYEYALMNDIVNKNYAEFLELPTKTKGARDRFTDLEVSQIEKAVGVVPYADYILCMCYTGFRITEFLSLNQFSVHEEDGIMYLVGGIKTDAGRDRPVPVHSKIIPIIRERIQANGKTLFCNLETKRPLTTDNFRKDIYYKALNDIGVRQLKPHATRRTFSTRAAAAGMDDKDIIALMGHTDIKTDMESYINQEVKTLSAAIELIS